MIFRLYFLISENTKVLLSIKNITTKKDYY